MVRRAWEVGMEGSGPMDEVQAFSAAIAAVAPVAEAVMAAEMVLVTNILSYGFARQRALRLG